jgi:predicted Zn-dependent protease
MRMDFFDRTILLLTGLLLVLLAGLQIAHTTTSEQSSTPSRTLERDLADQARTAFIEKVYAPVLGLMEAAQYQEALLKLEELNRRYPGEAHGQILKGEILFRMGAPAEAAASFVAGVKLNGDYIDRNHPLSRRKVMVRLIDSSAAQFSDRLNSSPANPSLKLTVSNFNYLRSRLAGGCE